MLCFVLDLAFVFFFAQKILYFCNFISAYINIHEHCANENIVCMLLTVLRETVGIFFSLSLV